MEENKAQSIEADAFSTVDESARAESIAAHSALTSAALPDSTNDSEIVMSGTVPLDLTAFYEPSPEELEAVALFNQHNTNPEPVQDARGAMTAQEIADFELALALQNDEELQEIQDRVPDQDMPPESQECACGEVYKPGSFTNVVWLACGHVRCPPCFNENVRVGLESKKNFPPRCCPRLPIEVADYEALLEPDVMLRYRAVKDEYSDIAPVYCATKSCSKYLPRSTFSSELRWATCADCTSAAVSSVPTSADSSTTSLLASLARFPSITGSASTTSSPSTPTPVRTCTGCLCLESDHISPTKCPERIDRMDKDLMVKKGWKPCPGCKEMIEKDDGCDHMQCECGHEFCYQCGRSYMGGVPCNCHGRNAWVEELDEEENDPAAQRQIWEEIQGDGPAAQEW